MPATRFTHTARARRMRAPVVVLALVLLAGGAATAVAGPAQVSSLIKGSSIKKRSIAGNRVKRDTLGGKEISESKLGIVPLATHATTADTATRASAAGRADTATSAANATHAASATTATTATTAANANALGGKPASSYAGGPGQLVFVRRDVFAFAAQTFYPVFTLPGVGTLETACRQGSFAFDIVWTSADGVGEEDVDLRVYDNAHTLGAHTHTNLSNGGATFVHTITTQGGTFELQVGSGHGQTARAASIEGLVGRADTAASCRLTLTGTAL